MKTTYIHQLPTKVRDCIYSDLQLALTKECCEDLDTALEDAMNSRLSDLEDTIDISKYQMTL